MDHNAAVKEKFDEIINAIGKRSKFSEKAKYEFANAIYWNLYMGVTLGETFLPKIGKELLGDVQALKNTIDNLQHKLEATWEGMHAGNAAFKQIGLEKDEYLNQSFLLVEALRQEITSRTARNRPGQDNTRTQSIAKMIAIEYFRHFQQYPSTGNGKFIESRQQENRKPKLTPYDRVCNIVQKTYTHNKPIKFATRKAAIKEVKNGGGIRPLKTI